MLKVIDYNRKQFVNEGEKVVFYFRKGWDFVYVI